MMQEVEVTLTLTVEASKSKEQIKRFVEDMADTYSAFGPPNNRFEFPKVEVKGIREEAEIYNNK
jgi:hypothetical protein